MTPRLRVGGGDAAARRWIAGGVWAVSWTLAIASLAIAWIAQLPAEPLPGVFLSPAPPEMQARFDDIGVTVALIYGPVSALILARRPHPVGVIIALHAVGSGIAAFGVQYGLLGAQVPGLPLWGLVAFAAGWGFVPGTFMTAVLPILVTRAPLPRWQRALVALCSVFAGAAFFASLTQQTVPTPRNPLAIDIAAYQAALPPVYTALSFAAVAISFVSLAVLIARWTRARGRTRVGLSWLTIGHLFLTLSYLALVLPEGLDLPSWAVDFGLVAPVLGQILYPAAILVVVLGQRLWGVALVVSRLLLWSLLTFAGVALYLVLVAALPVTLAGVDALSLLVPVVIALAILPLRGWLQRRIDRLVYGDGADRAHLLTRLGERIGELPPGAAGLTDLAHTLRSVLRLGWVEIHAGGQRAESGVRVTGEPVRVPLSTGGEAAGELRAQPIGGQRFDRRTLVVLADVAGLVSTVVRLAESYEVLDTARSDLVARRAEERRAIRRELHDGLGPALAGIGFGLAAVENLAASDPRRARDLLAELTHDIHRRLREVRDLANAVSPSPLDGEDLADALRRLVSRFASPALRVHATVAGDAHLSPDIAEALYLVAAEALANAARHSGARHVAVRVTAGAESSILEVSDNGRGIPEDATPGIGMTSMRERAAAHGGVLDVSSGRRGTVVTVSLPAARSAIQDYAS
jgi:signal transduction histidine kinase